MQPVFINEIKILINVVNVYNIFLFENINKAITYSMETHSLGHEDTA